MLPSSCLLRLQSHVMARVGRERLSPGSPTWSLAGFLLDAPRGAVPQGDRNACLRCRPQAAGHRAMLTGGTISEIPNGGRGTQ